MAAPNDDSPDPHYEVIRSAPYLAWRILIGIFCYGCASVVIRNLWYFSQGEPVTWAEVVFGIPFFAVGGYLFPQIVILSDSRIEQIRYFWLWKTRIPVEDIHFYWETNRRELNDYLGRQWRGRGPTDREPVVLVQSKDASKRVVLTGYHVGRDRIVASLRARGIPSKDQAFRVMANSTR